MRDLTGQFGLTKIGGRVGWWIGLGQFLLGDASTLTHAFVVVGDHVVEAMPGGAILTPLSYYTDGSKAQDTVFSNLRLTDEQKTAVAREALDLVGTPYSFADYLSLALAHWRIRPRWLRDYIADAGHLICSALVDRAYARAGVQLFADDRPYGDVTPGDLTRCLYSDLPVR